MSKSEFGQGLCYNLGLFIGHEFRLQNYIKEYESINKRGVSKGQEELFTESRAIEMWFSGAADHFLDFLPEYAPKHLQARCERLKEKCLHWRMAFGVYSATLDDASWALQEAKDLLRLIDKANGVPTIKGDWE